MDYNDIYKGIIKNIPGVTEKDLPVILNLMHNEHTKEELIHLTIGEFLQSAADAISKVKNFDNHLKKVRLLKSFAILLLAVLFTACSASYDTWQKRPVYEKRSAENYTNYPRR